MSAPIERYATPPGTARYAWLHAPDTKFDADGVFRTQLLIPAEECRGLTERLDRLAEDAAAKARKENPGKKITLNPPYTEEEDDAGKPTGRIVFKLKKPALRKKQDGTVVPVTIPCFDAKLTKIDMPPVYTGSIIRINFTPTAYYVPAHRAAGLSLWINSVQVLKLVTFDRDGEFYGYQEVEDGYAAGADDPRELEAERTREDHRLRGELETVLKILAQGEDQHPSAILLDLTADANGFGGCELVKDAQFEDLGIIIGRAYERVGRLGKKPPAAAAPSEAESLFGNDKAGAVAS
jgi:hypothetical protein